MQSFEKIAMGIVVVALVTTLILPGRQTATVVRAGSDFFSTALKTAMGR